MLEKWRRTMAGGDTGVSRNDTAADTRPSVLNVGGGSKSIAMPDLYAGWSQVLLDIKDAPDVDLTFDARRLGQLPGQMYAAVFCSHNLEHYYRHEVKQVLQGFRHVLEETGFCDIRVPDLQAVFAAALAAGEDLEAPLYQSPAGPVSALDVIYGFDEHIEKSGEPYYAHKTGFTALTLERSLREAGFAEVLVSRHPGYELRALALNSAVASVRGSHQAAILVDALYAWGRAAWSLAQHDVAARAAQLAIALDPTLPALHYLFGYTQFDLERWQEAASAFEQCLALGPRYPLAMEARLRAALARVRLEGKAPPLLELPLQMPALVSVVICSVRPDRLARAKAAYASAFSASGLEVIAITDARSLAEGYNRGLAAARGELVVFSHDDIDIAAPDFAARLFRHLERADLVGVAGTTGVAGPSWLAGDWTTLAGQIALPGADRRLAVTAYGPSIAATGAQALDGVFLACRTEVARRLRFDAEVFDGWHGYDFDFSFRAHLAGYRCAVAGDLLLVHDSCGNFDSPDWRRYAERALIKHRERLPAGCGMPEQPQLCSLDVASAEEWRAFSAELEQQSLA